MKFLLKSCLLMMIFCCCFFETNAQIKLIDSLKVVLKNTPKDSSEKIANTYLNIGKVFNYVNVDSSLKYSRFGLKITLKNKLKRHQLQAYNNIGTSYIRLGKLDSSEVYFDKAKQLLPEVNHYIALNSYYGDRGILHLYQGDYKKASIEFKKALELSKKENNTKDIIANSNNAGLALVRTGLYKEAIELYYNTLKTAEEIKDTVQIGKINNNLAKIYGDLGESDKALKLYKKALAISIRQNSFTSKIISYFNVANTQLEIGEKNNDDLLVKEAKKNYDSVVKLSDKHNYGNGKLTGLEGLGKIALHYEEYPKSVEYFTEILKLVKESPNQPYENMANLSLGYIYVTLKNTKQAKFHLLQVKDFVEESGSVVQKKQLFENLHLVYLDEKNYEKAYEYLKKQKDLEDSLSSDEIKNKISEYEVKYETEKKENEILLQKEQLLKQELDLKTRNLYAILLASALLILAIISIGFYKRNQFKRKQLQKEIDLKDALSTIKTQNRLQEQRLQISRDLHDNIGSQLTFIISSIDNLKYITKDANLLLKDKLISISSFTSETIFQLRDTIWAMNKSEISIEDLHARILSFIEKAKSATENVEFKVHQEISEKITLTSITGMNFFRVIQEAINNSIKYAEASKIDISLNQKNDLLTVSIKDNGIGFDKNSVDLGNGLSNMEKRMNEVGGNVFIHSEVGKGTTIQLICKL